MSRKVLYSVQKKLPQTLLFTICFLFVYGLNLLLFSGLNNDSRTFPTNTEPLETTTSERPTVILDPGHGGIDGGTVSASGVLEKDLNLCVSKILGEFLEAEGCQVIYTRTDDVLLDSGSSSSRKVRDLTARVKVAKDYPNAVFVSIHMNYLPQPQYSGLQVFYDDKNAANTALALSVQNDVRRYLQPENHREIKEHIGRIFLLDRIESPAVLIECGFLSNSREADLLCSKEYQQKLAFILSRSILASVSHSS